VDIQGNVDRYAPVSIKGSLMPFDPLKKLDIATAFKHVELTTLTPYSGKFAGYRIQKGRLSLDLHYQISDGKLNASNQLLLEQLQLGERVDSPDAVDLPVRLAIALLKDRKGEIALNLPVQGDLNNPEFKVAPIVWQTLRNLITRAVSAPFNFIADLAGGNAAELNEVVFLPGEFVINSNAAQGLDTLTKALKDRPQLRLEIEGGSRADLDGPPLAQMRLTRAYQNAWYSILQRRGGKIDASKENIEVPDDEKPALLEGIYRTQLKQQPPTQWAELKKDQRAQKMSEAVLHSYAQSPVGLRRLAQARANSIKEYLVEQAQLDAERVYLLDVSEGKVSADSDGVISTLHLGSM
jgi:outer membrane protein OmpA-like peptidoglycan-associated protein